ncbi:hypothetical protein AB3S75_038508 [Citrus x aurantiifolia]
MCMIILSSKAYNIPAPVLSVKTSLVDKTNCLWSNEDNEDALKYLSAIERTESQSKESIATLIVKFVARSSDEDSSGIKQQLLKEFTPSDGFPSAAQLFTESCHGFEPSLITTDNDVSPIAFGNQTDPFTLAEETPNLLGVDELLDSVSNKTPQVGRSSVSTPSNMPYNEMAGNCEALLMGKHQKMSVSMSSQA